MLQKSKVRINKGAMLPACVTGIATALVVSVGGTLVGAICILNEYFDITAVVIVATITQLVSAVAGSFLTGKLVKEGKMLSCCITVFVYCFILLGTSILFFDGIGSGVFGGLITCTLSCIGGFLLSTREKNDRKHKRKGKRTC